MSDFDAGRLVEALGVYERIALAGLRNPAHLDWLTLLPSSQVRAHLVTLVDAGLIGAGAEVELSPLTAVAADLPVDAATRERIAELQAYWAAHAPHEAGMLHGSPGFWTQWWLILTAHHRWPVDRAMPRDEPLGAPAAGPLHFDVVMPALPGFYEREWVENIDRGLLGRLAADGWMECRMIVPAATADHLAADLVDLVRSFGFEVRVLDVAQWFAVYRPLGIAVVPEAPGDAFDGFIARVEQPLAVWGLAELFDRSWASAEPWRAHAPVRSRAEVAAASRAAEVLELLAQGMPDEHIAAQLGITDRTVRRHVAAAMETAGAATRFQLGAWWAASRT